MPKVPKRPLGERFPSITPLAMDLMEKMLMFDPAKRISGGHRGRCMHSRMLCCIVIRIVLQLLIWSGLMCAMRLVEQSKAFSLYSFCVIHISFSLQLRTPSPIHIFQVCMT